MMNFTKILGAMMLAVLLAACGSSEAGAADTAPVVVDPNATANAQLVLDTAPD